MVGVNTTTLPAALFDNQPTLRGGRRLATRVLSTKRLGKTYEAAEMARVAFLRAREALARICVLDATGLTF